MSITRCPHCDNYAYETLETHSYCIECSYSPDFESRYEDEDHESLDWSDSELDQLNKASAAMSDESEIKTESNRLIKPAA